MIEYGWYSFLFSIPGIQLYQLLPLPARFIIAVIAILTIGSVGLSSFRMIWHLKQIAVLRVVQKRIRRESWLDSASPEQVQRMQAITHSIPVVNRMVEDIARLMGKSARHFIPDTLDLGWRRLEDSGWLSMIPRLTILLGFLGTLLGLTTAVENVFFRLDNMKDIESLRAPIQETLSGLSIAFTTTLMGVFAALLLTPFILLTQRIHQRWKHTVENIVLVDILPILIPEDLDLIETVKSLVESVSRQVVEKTFSQVVSETSSKVQDLTLQLTDAVKLMTEQRADMGQVVETLDHAATSFKTSADRSADLLGRLDERLWNLSETVERLTPESDLRIMTVQTIGETLNHVLADQWADLCRHLQEQIDKIDGMSMQLDRTEQSFVQCIHQLQGDLVNMPGWRSVLHESLAPLVQSQKDSQQNGMNLIDWKSFSQTLGMIQNVIFKMNQTLQEALNLLSHRIPRPPSEVGSLSPQEGVPSEMSLVGEGIPPPDSLRDISMEMRNVEDRGSDRPLVAVSAPVYESLQAELRDLATTLHSLIAIWETASNELQTGNRNFQEWMQRDEARKSFNRWKQVTEKGKSLLSKESVRKWGDKPKQWWNRFRKRGRE